MSLQKATQYGASYKWGVKSTDVPTIASGFSPRNGDFSFEPEIDASFGNGEGHTDLRVTSKPAYRKITCSISGYISTSFNPLGVPTSFNFTPAGSTAVRTFTVLKIGEPIKKGEYTEVTIEAESKRGTS